MSQKILGIDLGTNSLGIAVRNADLGKNITEQLEYYTSIIFPSGVGTDKSGEYSYAAKRTKFRSTRRLYQSRKYRIWATLRLLIEHGCCPLKNEELDRWSRYDKEKGLKRQYPVDAEMFEQWVRLDFNCDGMPEYSSPYQLRKELMERVLDWNNPIDRYKFGRAMYHIAQRRGFKSSKGETLKESKEDVDVDTIDISGEMKKSEEKTSHKLSEYIVEHNLPTAGCAFARLEREGVRVRNSEYKAVQSQYRDEVDKICRYQHIDEIAPELHRSLVSTKKGEGTIFYRRPLRSQKGMVGKCTLEPTRRRCPVSHPDFEEFRALSFINNIKYRLSTEDEWKTLTADERQELFESLFTRANATFKFEDIRKWLEKKKQPTHFDYNTRTINYHDHTTVAGCPVISRLKKILGDNWRSCTIITEKSRTNFHTGEVHNVRYNYTDIWHLAYSSDDYEELAEFCENQMGFTKEQCSQMTRLWSAIQEGYASLSQKAIHNILPFLREGIIYSEAVAFAKIPDIIGHDQWEQQGNDIMEKLRCHIEENGYLRMIYGITNTLIANYKTSILDVPKNRHDTDYILDDTDKTEVHRCIINTLSTTRWNNFTSEEQDKLQHEVEQLYQKFFATSDRDYYKLPRQSDTMKEYLISRFPDISVKVWDTLYHHSQVGQFPQEKQITEVVDGKIMNYHPLGKPDIGSIKNPVALRALYVLRRAVNELLRHGFINEETRVVVETAREMNDANWRRAIEMYQKAREKENDAIIEIIKESRPNYTDADIEKGRLFFEQSEIPDLKKERIDNTIKKAHKEKAQLFAVDMQKYKLWKEQKFRCIYTGDIISLSNLFDDDIIQIEHTIPKSISFNNSLSNRTVCFTYANKQKNNRIPSELPNYSDIKDRIKPWEEKVVHIKAQIELWKGKAKTAATMERKNECLQQKHLWELEKDYWETKLNTFTVQKDDLNLGFRNSQIVDTRIITKYAFHYLKSVFSRVDVQKGSITANFRKILGLQSADEKKDRQKHSHHAIDAAVLTMIPHAAQRDRMLELFYQLQEADDMSKGTIQLKLKKEVDSCNIGTITGLVDSIEQNILVNHISKDQTLTPAKKKMRKTGKIVYKDKDSKTPFYKQGDSIRGKLHEDTFLGAIIPPKYTKDENGEYHIENKEKNSLHEDSIRYVVRRELDKLFPSNSPWTWDTLEKNIVNKELYTIMRSQFPENTSFKEAVAKGIYMLDKNGRKVNKIRHIRCYSDNTCPLCIKKQTYKSKDDYKQYYYAANNSNAYMAIYWSGIMGEKRDMEVRNLFDLAKMKETSEKMSIHDCFEKRKGDIPLYAIVRPGTNVLIFDKSEVKKGKEAHKEMIEKFRELDNEKISKRLYTISSFEKNGTTILLHHTRPDKDLGRGSSKIDLHNPNPKDRVAITMRYMLVEGTHFTIDGMGKIHFIQEPYKLQHEFQAFGQR